MVSRSGDDSRTLTARYVIREAAVALRGSHRDGVRVDGLFHYGAVDVNPRLLVVWILLSGRPSEQLPEWMLIDPRQMNPTCPVDYGWLVELRGHIVRRFHAVGWPQPQQIAVYADSAQRVDTAGRSYFTG